MNFSSKRIESISNRVHQTLGLHENTIYKTARAVHLTKLLPEQAGVDWYAHVLWDLQVFTHELAICFLLQAYNYVNEYYCLGSLLLQHQAG